MVGFCIVADFLPSGASAKEYESEFTCNQFVKIAQLVLSPVGWELGKHCHRCLECAYLLEAPIVTSLFRKHLYVM